MLQTAEVREGFHLDGGVVVLADQARNGREQGTDLIVYAAPVYGFGDGVEIGLPLGAYVEGDGAEGTDDVEAAVMPYVKARIFESGPHRLLFAGQLAVLLPGSAGLIYGVDLDGFLPHVAVKRVFSYGPAGDDPLVTRYQEKGQSLWIISIGGRLAEETNLAFEAGVLRNSYEEGALFGDFDQATIRRTLYDLFAIARFSF